MQLALCRHIKTNGTRCKAPSLTDGLWCYFHSRLHQRHQTFRHTEATRGYLVPGQHIELSALEDRESVQVALSVVINALATGKLDIKRATALLYGLQLASTMPEASTPNPPPPPSSAPSNHQPTASTSPSQRPSKLTTSISSTKTTMTKNEELDEE